MQETAERKLDGVRHGRGPRGSQRGRGGEGGTPDNTAKQEVGDGKGLRQLDLDLGGRNAQLTSHVAEALAGCQEATNLVGSKVKE